MMKRTMMIGLALAAGFVVASGGAADGGGGFGDFYRQHQSRLLTQFDGALAAKAAAAAENFMGVKKAGVQLQTPLGGRRGNVGADIIGAFDESDNHAVGWQARGYVGEESTTGANAGVFYRAIKGGERMLFGANAFVDFEDSDYGNFTRFGVGGEVRHPRVRFDANYYAPLSGSKLVRPGVAAFSREGLDARLRLSVPDLQGINAAVDYYNYNFDGRDDVKDDDGFRLGAEFVPWSDFRINLFYDNGDDKFGGDIVYAWTIGEQPQGNYTGANNYAPDLFAPIAREYSQRIATVAVPFVSLSISVDSVLTTETTTMMTMTTRVTNAIAPITTASVLATTLIGNQDTGWAGLLLDKVVVTLPPSATPGSPYNVTTLYDLGQETRVQVVERRPNTHSTFQIGNIRTFAFGPENVMQTRALSVVVGSEDIIMVSGGGEVTITTRTTTAMTMTMRATTFATTRITLSITTGSIPPTDGAFPFDKGNNKGNTPPLFAGLPPFDNDNKSNNKDSGMTTPPLAIVAADWFIPPAKSAAGYYLPPACEARGGCEFANGKVAGGVIHNDRPPKGLSPFHPPPQAAGANIHAIIPA